jgi:hypothetical protein
LKDYDNGTILGGLEHRDSSSWKPKSWVVGVLAGNNAKAYDWNWVSSHRFTEDTIGTLPVLIYYTDSNFRVMGRTAGGHVLGFNRNPDVRVLLDTNTGSVWDPSGLCISGPLKGQQLQPFQSYQEFWHSWSYFHPTTTQYNP